MILRLTISLLFGLGCMSTNADITKEQGTRILLEDIPSSYKSSDKQYIETYKLASPLFQSDTKLSERYGLDSYAQLDALAKFGDKYSLYQIGHVQLQYNGIFKSSLRDAVQNLENSANQDVVHAQHALGLVFKFKADEIAKFKTRSTDQIKGLDSIQYFLKGAQKGFGPSYLMACRDFETGFFLAKNVFDAEQCYINALKFYDQKKAMAYLGNLYLHKPEFQGSEFEFKGLDLIQEAADSLNDEYAMAVWGYYLVKSKDPSNLQKGKELLQQAVMRGSKDAELILKKLSK